MASNAALIQELDDMQRAVDRWYQQSSSNLQSNHSMLMAKLRVLEARFGGSGGSGDFSVNMGSLDTIVTTPLRPGFSNQHDDLLASTPSASSPPVSHRVLNYDVVDGVVAGMKSTGAARRPEVEAELCKRPNPDLVRRDPRTPPSDKNTPCHVLVEFKRKRILQYESPYYVAPGEYVVVGGDRGEDIGLVTHSWTDSEAGNGNDKPWATGAGAVLRVASVLEVTQLQGVQTELENRAVEVAQEKVQEHALPMRIVDAEYQFDRRKLTFYFHSQHRLDFRNLVRDLYKTFRARIWMEPDGAA